MPYWPQEIIDELGPIPPKPTAADKANPDANRAKLAAWRDYEIQAENLLEAKQRGGRTLADMGVKDVKEQGKWLYDRERALSEYGGGFDARWIYDWVHGTKKKRAGLDQSEGRIAITPEEYAARNQIERFKGKNQGAGYEQMLGHQGLKQMLGYGHLNRDPITGLYFNIGHGDPNNPSTWQWVDKYNQRQQPPNSQQYQQILQANQAQVTGAGGTNNFGSNSPFQLPEGYSLPANFNQAMIDRIGGPQVLQQLLQQSMMFGGGNEQFQAQLQRLMSQSQPASTLTPNITPPSISQPATITAPAIGQASIQAPNINPALSSQPNSPFSVNNPATSKASTFGYTKPKPQNQPDDFGAMFSPSQSRNFLSQRQNNYRPFSPGRMNNNPFGI